MVKKNYKDDPNMRKLKKKSYFNEQSCFCKLAKGNSSNPKTCYLKSLFCVFHPLLGERNINSNFFLFSTRPSGSGFLGPPPLWEIRLKIIIPNRTIGFSV